MDNYKITIRLLIDSLAETFLVRVRYRMGY